MNILYLGIVIGLTVFFLHSLSWEGMLLEPITSRLWNLPSWMKKPLFDCPICMCPWWGSIILGLYMILPPVGSISLGGFILTVLTASGFNACIIFIRPEPIIVKYVTESEVKINELIGEIENNFHAKTRSGSTNK